MRPGPLAFAVFFFAVILAPQIRATTVTITIKGTVHSGSDTTGVFGLGAGYSFDAHPDLQPFILTLNFDDTKGVQTVTYCGSSIGYSSIANSTASNPGTGALSIHGSTPFSFGGGAYGESGPQSYFGLWQFGGCWYSRVGTGIAVNYTTGGYSGNSSVGSLNGQIIGPSSPLTGTLSRNYDWRTTFAAVSTYTRFPVNFFIQVYSGGALSLGASGTLTPTSIAVSGASCSSTPSISIDSSSTGKQPNILQAGETTSAVVKVSPAAALTVGLASLSSGFNYGTFPAGVAMAGGTGTFQYVSSLNRPDANEDSLIAFACNQTPAPLNVFDYNGSSWNYDIHKSQLSDTLYKNPADLSQAQIQTFLTTEQSFLAKFYFVDTGTVAGRYQDGFFDTNGNGMYDTGEPVYCHGGGTSCLPAPGKPTKRADAVIAALATANTINPKLLLTELQAQSGLVGYQCTSSCTLPAYTVLNYAMGCTGSGTAFASQINCAAQTFASSYASDLALGEPYFFPINTSLGYNGNIKLAHTYACSGSVGTGCDYVGLNIVNAATHAQYSYTPFVQTAPNCTGGVCSFEKTFHDYSLIW